MNASISTGTSGRRIASAVALALLCAVLIVAATPAALAQGNQGPQNQKAAEESTGARVLGTVGRWFDDALSTIGSSFRGARSTVGNLGDEAGQAAKATASATANVAKGAADAVTRLPGARVVKGRQTCTAAANGAPDCVAAASALCRSKGFGSGTSVDITSAEECPAAVMLGRRDAKAGECRPVTFVTSAFCAP